MLADGVSIPFSLMSLIVSRISSVRDSPVIQTCGRGLSRHSGSARASGLMEYHTRSGRLAGEGSWIMKRVHL